MNMNWRKARKLYEGKWLQKSRLPSWSSAQCGGVLRSHLLRRVHIPELLGGHPVHHDADALDEGEEDPADDGAAHHVLRAVPGGHDGARGGPAGDGVPRVLLLAEVREGAVEAGEAEAPRGELAAEDGSALLHADEATEPAPAEAGGGVPRARHEVEEGAADEAHREGAAAVVDHSPRAGRAKYKSFKLLICINLYLVQPVQSVRSWGFSPWFSCVFVHRIGTILGGFLSQVAPL